MSLFDIAKGKVNKEKFKDHYWEGAFEDYLEMVKDNPNIARTSFQRVYDMVVSKGTEEIEIDKESMLRYDFFTDPKTNGEDAIFGIERYMHEFVEILKAAALRYGPEKRIILLHGPVGSAKSTIVRVLKHGYEKYTATKEGAMYTYHWTMPEGNGFTKDEIIPCPMHDEPLYLLPDETKEEILGKINESKKTKYKIMMEGEMCPVCRFNYLHLMKKYNGDWEQLIKHVTVTRLIASEQDRICIGTFAPRDPKDQDSTELTGDINYRKIARYGSDSDPRAFNFTGEFNIANRGIVEFIEVFKLETAFLYDLLGASQEHLIKPKKFALTHIDEVICSHTNEPEFKKLQSNEFMEALRDRTIKVDIPYNIVLTNEVKIYEKSFNSEKIVGKHIAPHTLEVAAMWAILTRLEEPKNANLTVLQKMKLYNGKLIDGFTSDNIKELKRDHLNEGMKGISPRYIQDKISNALVNNKYAYVGPFMVLNELEEGLEGHSLISDEKLKDEYRKLFAIVKQEFENIVKKEVQEAISADEDSIKRLFFNYLDNIKAHTQSERVKNKFTGEYEYADERLMRSIEEKIDIPESRKDEFRSEIMNFVGAMAVEGKNFYYDTNERLHQALEAKLFEDKKDSIKLSSLVSNIIDKETQERIDIVKARLIRRFGYNDESATDVLNFVSSIFARGDILKGK